MKQLSIIILLCITFLSCKKDKSLDENPIDNNPLNNITIQLKSEVVPVPPKTYSSPHWMFIKMTNIGKDIYMAAPKKSTPPIIDGYFLKYNLNTKTFTILATNPKMYETSGQLLNNGTNIYNISGNYYLRRYRPSTNSWDSLNFPSNIYSRVRQSGSVLFYHKIFFLGGDPYDESGISDEFRYYDITLNDYFNLPNAPYKIRQSEMAYVDNRIYVVGGINPDLSYNLKMSVFGYDSNSWSILPDVNFIMYNDGVHTSLISYKERYLIAISNTTSGSFSISIFDTQTQKWKDTPIEFPYSNTNTLNLLNIDDKIYVASNSTAGDLFLSELEFQNLPS
jgi:hypothetical protein